MTVSRAAKGEEIVVVEVLGNFAIRSGSTGTGVGLPVSVADEVGLVCEGVEVMEVEWK